MSDQSICRRLLIHGLVQGVGYRWATADQAQRIGGLRGWVRNRRDGTVEALVAGEADAVAELIAWAERGPPAARVSRVLVSEANPVDLPASGFATRPTF